MEGAGYGQPPQTQQHSGPATSSTSRSAGEEVASSSQQQAGSVAHTAAAPAAATAVQLTPEQLAAIQYQQYFAQLQAVQQQQQQQQQSEATGQPVAAWPSGAASEGVGQSQQPLYVVSSSAASDWQRSVGLWSQLPPGVAQYQFAPSLAPVAVSGAPSSSGQQQLLHAPVLAPPAFPPGLAGKMPEGVYTTAPSGLMGSSGLDSSGLGKMGGGVGKRSAKRPRLVWTHELHSRFINAVNHLGVKNAVPITILQLMNVEGMTRENVASHLQKYRLHLKRLAGVAPNATIPPEMLPQVQAQAHAQHQQQLQQVALNPQGRAALVSHPGGQLLQTSAPQSTQVAAPAQQTQLMPEQQQQQQHQGMLAAQGLQFVGIPQAGGAPPMMLHPGGAPAMQQWQGMPLAITSLQGAAAAAAAGAGGQQAPPLPVATGETQQHQQAPHAQGLFYVPGGEQAAYHQAAAYQQYPVTLLGYSQAPGGGEQAAQQQQQQQQQLMGSRAPGPMSLLPAGYQAMMQPGSWLPQASPAFPMPPLPMAEATATPVHSQPPAQTTTQQS